MVVEDDAPEIHAPLGEDGKGMYSLSTRGCFDVINSIRPALLEALEEVTTSNSQPGGSPLTICDYGTADGGTSLPTMNALVGRAKEKDPKRDIQVIYEDQPGNEWKSVFSHALGKLPVPGSKRSYLEAFPTGVYALAAGRSFYDQVIPACTLDLGLAATCMHWLSALPGQLPEGYMHHTQVPRSDPALGPFQKQAAVDWERILLHRARELRKGGRCLLVNFCHDAKGQCLGKTENLKACMYDEKYKCWKAMADEGRITKEELNRTTFPNYYRTEEETTAPLKDENSEVYKAGLRLVSCETKVVPCPYRACWLADPKQDAITYARDFVLTTRTWSNSTYEAALDATRTPAERRALVDEMFERYAQEVAKEPAAHGMDYVHAHVMVTKT
eukprot:TRINITY_DN69584_c0_g1_i1.p1 TRINITY_DN69584_c0_g1~~TRINITY_DN69584_c0_g1_i1.p1  ORF type:complete len:387 (+),score=63.23 TRINITY_DN69584_c0_g1_i1:60-1220(+)